MHKLNPRWLLLLAVILYFSSCTQSGSNQILRSKDFGFGESHDCTPAALEMLKAAGKQSNSKIIIERGIYHFYPEKAFEKFCYVTNHDDGLRSTPFPILGFEGLEIEADSAEFIFHGIILPFIIENSSDIKLSGFSIDWEIPLHSEVKVLAVDESNHTFDIAVDRKNPYEIRNGELIFLKEGYEHNLERAICWDPESMAIAYNTWASTPLTLRKPSTVRNLDVIDYFYKPEKGQRFTYRGEQNSLLAEELEPGLIRISGHRKGLPKPGNIIVAKGRNAYNRFAPGIHIHSSRDILIQNVSLHHAGGMGLVAERSENITLDQFNVMLKPGSGRMLTTTADATHFNNCKGLVRMSNCLFENMLDDGTNIHGVYAIVEDIIDKYTLGIKMGHFQQLGFEFATPGDRVGFVETGGSLHPYYESKVASLEKINKVYYIIQFDEEIDPDVKAGDLLDNLDWYPEVELVNNTVRNNRARGFLISTPENSLLEGNYFSSMDQAISVHGGFGGYWYESGFAGELIIRNNYFADNVYSGRERAVIDFHAEKSNDPFLFKKIIVEDNEFRTFDPLLMNPEGIDSLIIRNNTISKSGTYPPLFGDNPMIRITKVNYTEFSGNKIKDFIEKDINMDNHSMPGFITKNNEWLDE